MKKTEEFKKFIVNNSDFGFEFGEDITPNLRGLNNLDYKKRNDTRNSERLNLSIYPGE